VENVAKENAKLKPDDAEGVIIKKVREITTELASKHPYQLLAERRKEAGKSPKKNGHT
jgi:hypothetical protein